MSSLRPATLCLLACALLLGPAASAQHRRDQDAAREAYRAGHVKSLHEIEQHILPQMAGADYLGPEFDGASAVYRLKFMRAGQVSWVDVDARTGAVINRPMH